MSTVQIVLCKCSGNVLIGYVIACPTFYVLYGMTKKGCVKLGLPVKGVRSGRVGS